MADEVEAHRVTNDDDWEIYRARYDEFIRYCDRQFEDFMNEWSKREQSKNTIVIFTSDHGESFEHNYFTHNTIHHYEQVTHIPLIIKEPEQTEGVIVNDLTGQIDLPSTVLDLANIEVPSWMEGRSLVPLLRGQKVPAPFAWSEGSVKKCVFHEFSEKSQHRGKD
jgi:arylsulfatase A-like enzyme